MGSLGVVTGLRREGQAATSAAAARAAQRPASLPPWQPALGESKAPAGMARARLTGCAGSCWESDSAG